MRESVWTGFDRLVTRRGRSSASGCLLRPAAGSHRRLTTLRDLPHQRVRIFRQPPESLVYPLLEKTWSSRAQRIECRDLPTNPTRGRVFAGFARTPRGRGLHHAVNPPLVAPVDLDADLVTPVARHRTREKPRFEGLARKTGWPPAVVPHVTLSGGNAGGRLYSSALRTVAEEGAASCRRPARSKSGPAATAARVFSVRSQPPDSLMLALEDPFFRPACSQVSLAASREPAGWRIDPSRSLPPHGGRPRAPARLTLPRVSLVDGAGGEPLQLFPGIQCPRTARPSLIFSRSAGAILRRPVAADRPPPCARLCPRAPRLPPLQRAVAPLTVPAAHPVEHFHSVLCTWVRLRRPTDESGRCGSRLKAAPRLTAPSRPHCGVFRGCG